MFFVVIGKIHKDYGSNLSVIAITTDKKRAQQVIDETENNTNYLITDSFIIEVNSLDKIVFAVNEDYWDYSDE